MFERFRKSEQKKDEKLAKVEAPAPFITRFATYCKTHTFDTGPMMGRLHYQAHQTPSNASLWNVAVVIDEMRDGQEVLQFHPLKEGQNVTFIEAMNILAAFENRQNKDGYPIMAEADEHTHFQFVYESEGIVTDENNMPVQPIDEHIIAGDHTFLKSDLDRGQQRYAAAKSNHREVNQLPSVFNDIFNQVSHKGNFTKGMELFQNLEHLDTLFEHITSITALNRNTIILASKCFYNYTNKQFKNLKNQPLPYTKMSDIHEWPRIDSNNFTLNGTDFYAVPVNNALYQAETLDTHLKQQARTLIATTAVEKFAMLAQDQYQNIDKNHKIHKQNIEYIKILDTYIETLLTDILKVPDPEATHQHIRDFIAGQAEHKQSLLGEKTLENYQAWRKAINTDEPQKTPSLEIDVPYQGIKAQKFSL